MVSRKRYTKKQRAADAKKWKYRDGNQPAPVIRETIRVTSTKHVPATPRDWTLAKTAGGKCSECRKEFLIGDMVAKGSRPRRHYICFASSDGGGKRG